jgi:uracil-DNA glycosylase
MRMRGRWVSYAAGTEIRALAMLHPAYLLRQPAQKKLAWQDLRTLGKEINRLQLFAKGDGERDGT